MNPRTTSPIKVLFVADKLSIGGSSLHGVTKLFSWWIPRFDKNRFRVSLCCLRYPDEAGAYLEKLGIKVSYLSRGKFDPMTLRDLLKIIKEQGIQVLHLHGYGSTNFGRIASLFSGIPCIVHEHMYDEGIPFYQRFMDRLLSRVSCRGIAVSNYVKEFLVHQRAQPEEKVQIIHNGVPLEEFVVNGKNESQEWKEDWKVSHDIQKVHKLVGIVGRLHLIKGHCYFLEAARLVLQNRKDVTFLVAGDGDLMPSLKEQAHSLGIDENIRFLGHCEDVPSLIRQIDVKVIASLSEGSPIAVFEAMAGGCAIVSTNVGGVREIIEDGKTGFLVPPRNPNAIAEKVLFLLGNPPLCKEIGEKAKEAVPRYDISLAVRKLELCYEEILGKQ